tara:strand:- start:16 stop:591 length:576 start_codon:yes stop_codon:yes gene_type:complete
MREFLVFFLTVFVVFIIINKLYALDEVVQIKSGKDNIVYIVRDLPDAKEAADRLSEINTKVLRLIDSIKDQKKDGVDRLKENYNPNNLSETGINAKYTSYSVNKGEKISICLRNKMNNTFEDTNTVMFVVLHELSHVMTKTVGHDKTFWENMSYLLHEAEKIGIYNHQDYGKIPVDYCGMEINSTPYDLKK